MTSRLVSFNPLSIQMYLDNAITRWRGKLAEARGQNQDGVADMCRYYVDAFQSARVSLFGESLPSGAEDAGPGR